MSTNNVNTPKTTYITKRLLNCPVCGAKVQKEEILSGSGRLIAGDLTPELHRTYEPTGKYGAVYPLAYAIPVCPQCLYALLPGDFEKSLKPELKQLLQNETQQRRATVSNAVDSFDFTKVRTLREGIASHLLCMLCYEYFSDDACPIFKQGVSALRASWLAEDLHKEEPDANFNELALMLKRKAEFYYRHAVELEEYGRQPFSKETFLGPDQDYNFGFDGVQYLSGYLAYKYGFRDNKPARVQTLRSCRTLVSKIVGMGRTNKEKPSAILNLAREVFDAIGMEQASLSQEGFFDS